MALRILLLGDINSPHIQKWATGLANDNFEIGIFSFNRTGNEWYSTKKNIECLYQANAHQKNTGLSKLTYLLLLPRLLFIILKFKPAIIHAHYASSYGLLGALTFFKPLVVSVWGSDVIAFPRNKLKRCLMKFVFRRSSRISVTSVFLEQEVKKYTRKKTEVIPFGIDMREFYPRSRKNTYMFTFGFTKHLEPVYNPDKVLDAANVLASKYPHRQLKLIFIGEGSLRQQLQQRSQFHSPNLDIEFTGRIGHHFVPDYLNQMDVLVNVSQYESFGVSVAEAMACGVPVIVSDHPGFNDLVPGHQHGVICNASANDIYQAMETLMLDHSKRKLVADAAFERVKQNFNWPVNLKQMERFYNELSLN